jgi:hypothetical protein
MEPYPMKWFRFYDEVLNDPKVQRLPDFAFRCWVNLMCMANQGKPRGRILPDDIPYSLRMSDDRTEKMIQYFIDHGLLDREGDYLIPHAWDDRQFQSDNINERVQKHRRNVSGNVSRNVSKSLHVTPPDTDTDTDTEEPPKSPTGDQCFFDQFWSLVIRKEPSKAKARESWDKAIRGDGKRGPTDPEVIIAGLRRWIPVWETMGDKTLIPHATTWLNQSRWTVESPAMPSTSPNGRVKTGSRQHSMVMSNVDAARERAKERDSRDESRRNDQRPGDDRGVLRIADAVGGSERGGREDRPLDDGSGGNPIDAVFRVGT